MYIFLGIYCICVYRPVGVTHDDFFKSKPFPCYLPFVRIIHRLSMNSPHKGQWRGSFMFSFICAWISGWVNNRDAGDLKRHRAHYYVIVKCVVYHGISHNKYLCACYLSRFHGTPHRPRSQSENPPEVRFPLICFPTAGFSKWIHLKRNRVYDLWQIRNWWI